MNEQDLRDRMTDTISADLDQFVDPEPDLARGRRRLRRQRALSGIAAAAAVAAVAAAGVQYLPTSAGQDAAPPAAQEQTDPAAVRAKSAAHLTAVLRKHVDTKGAYTVGRPQHVIVGTADSSKPGGIGELTVTQNWRQGGGVGLLWVSVAHKEDALDLTKWCGPGFTKDLMRFSCYEVLAPNGRSIVGGEAQPVKSSKGKAYPLAGSQEPLDNPTHRERMIRLLWHGTDGGIFVRHERPDGQVVIVALLRVKSLHRVADGLPKGVALPDVTQEELAAAATDSAMSLPK
ncbi:hypothetical protein [Kribbella sp. NPDC023855]|uniref:hypothetical protein n=1 Tax=Kribbella sp. NPDC023855 TaxID=3154698 RepID=UPI0033EF6623